MDGVRANATPYDFACRCAMTARTRGFPISKFMIAALSIVPRPLTMILSIQKWELLSQERNAEPLSILQSGEFPKIQSNPCGTHFATFTQDSYFSLRQTHQDY